MQPIGSDKPAAYAAEVTPSDIADLSRPARGIYVGTEGAVKVTTTGGSTVTFTNVYGILPVEVVRVFSTGTTASGIVAMW